MDLEKSIEINNNLENLTKNTCDDDDDDVPQLSAETLKALQEFYAENKNKDNEIDEDWVIFT